MTWKTFLGQKAAEASTPSAPTSTRGTFQITAASLPAFAAALCNGWWTGLLSAPGIQTMAVLHEALAPTDKWPEAGQVVPVLIDLTNPKDFKIIWDEVLSRQDLGLQRAQALLNANEKPER